MSQSLKFIMYLRKSSESEERQELSIPAQLSELNALVERRELQVVGRPVEEAQSAKKPGRPLFNKVVAELKAGRADGILCWKLDRLARNPLDGGSLMWLIGEKVIKEIQTPGRAYTGSGEDKMLMSIEFGMATKYSDDLSANVQRGNHHALMTGRWPGYPKLGYVREQPTDGASLRDRRGLPLIADSARFDLLTKLWHELLAGVAPLDLLLKANQEWGLRTPIHGRNGGQPLSRAALYRLFRDEFYAGVMVRAGVRYTGTHPPMVNATEFQAAQAILDGRVQRTDKAKRLFFPYRGLIRCGTCSSLATARYVINRYGTRYNYYHCYRKERRYKFCPEPAVEERMVEGALQHFLDDLVLPPRWLREAGVIFERAITAGTKQFEGRRQQLAAQIEKLDGRAERLRRGYVDEILTQDEYQNDKKALDDERRQLHNNLKQLEDPQEYFQPWITALEWLNHGPYFLRDGTPEEKRDIVQRVTFNLVLSDKKLLIQAKNTFTLFENWRRFATVRAWPSLPT